MRGRRTTKFDKALGARIRARRVELGKGQEYLGKQLRISFQQVQKYEKGTNRVSAARLICIGKVLNIHPMALLSDNAAVFGTTAGTSTAEKFVEILGVDRSARIVKGLASLKDKDLRNLICDLIERVVVTQGRGVDIPQVPSYGNKKVDRAVANLRLAS